MKLRDYLIDKGITQEIFAERLDIGRSHLSCVIKGTRNASKKMAKNIEKETNGVISKEEILSGKGLGYSGKMKRAVPKEKVEQVNRFSLL